MKDKDSSTKGYYTHEKFGLVPIGWDVVKLGSSFDFFPTASYSRALLSENGDCGYIHYGDIHTRFDRFIDAETDTLPCISEDMAKRYTPIIDGDLIISDASEDYEGVGKSVEVINVGEKVIISGLHTLHLRVKNNEFIKGFKGYILNQEKVRNSILRIATGIKVYSVSKTELKKIYLPKPPEDEQIQITNILSLVDSAIQSTQNSIKAAEKLKKGLMQNLLTGKLKPDGTQRKNEELMITKYGYASKNWKYCKIQDLIKEDYILKVQDGNHGESHPVSSEFVRHGIPFIMASDISNGHIDYDNCKRITFERAEKLRIGFSYNGDVLISHKASIGYTCIVENASPYIMLTPQVTFYRVNPKKLIPEYLLYFFQMYTFQQIIEGLAKQSTRNYIGITNQKKMWIYLPEDIRTQEEIIKPLKHIDTDINNKKIKINSLQRLKKSLMQNLLTGKIRLKTESIKEVLNE